MPCLRALPLAHCFTYTYQSIYIQSSNPLSDQHHLEALNSHVTIVLLPFPGFHDDAGNVGHTATGLRNEIWAVYTHHTILQMSSALSTYAIVKKKQSD